MPRDIVESWMWQDPASIIDRLIARSTRNSARAAEQAHAPAPAPSKDRHYTQARKLAIRRAVKQVMGGKR